MAHTQSKFFEIFKLFFRIGSTGFGGPLAIIAILEEEVARKRNWITSQEFAETYAICKIFPGPISSQMSIAIGKHYAGPWGGIFAGIAFLLPSFSLLLALSTLYTAWGSKIADSTLVLRTFAGIQAATLALIVQSIFHLAKPHFKTTPPWLIAIPSGLVVVVLPRMEPLVIIAAGLLGLFFNLKHPKHSQPKEPSPIPNKKDREINLFLPTSGMLGTATLVTPKLLSLFWTCFKAGAFVYGTGLAIVPLLEAEVVGHYQWLTHSEFMDGLALGQMTPGPLAITVTFIGYRVAGILGAFLATFALFLPSFINVLYLLPRVRARLEHSGHAQAFSNFTLAAVIGAVVAVAIRLGFSTLLTPLSLIIFFIAWIAASKFRLPSWIVLPLGAMLGVCF